MPAAKKKSGWWRRMAPSPAEQDHQRRPGLPLRAQWSPDGTTHRVQRQGWHALAGDAWPITRCRKMAHSNRGRDPRLRLVAGRRLPGVQHERPIGFSALYIWQSQDGKLHHVTSGMFNESRPRLGSRRAIICTSWPTTNSSRRSRRSSSTLPRTGTRHLCHGSAQGRQESVPAGERRSHGQRRAKTPMPKTRIKTKTRRQGREGRAQRLAASISTASHQRVARVPLEADNYFGLPAKTDALIYAVAPDAVLRPRPRRPRPSLHIFRFQGPERDRPWPTISAALRCRSDGIESAGPAGQQAWNVYDATPTGAAARKPSPPRA